LPEPLQQRVFSAQNTIAIFINSPAMGSTPKTPAPAALLPIHPCWLRNRCVAKVAYGEFRAPVLASLPVEETQVWSEVAFAGTDAVQNSAAADESIMLRILI
jgi:hypothetical protein